MSACFVRMANKLLLDSTQKVCGYVQLWRWCHLQRMWKGIKRQPEYYRGVKLSSESDNNHLCKEKIMKTSLVVSKRPKECKERALWQKIGLEKLKTMGGERWKESKYVYVIGALQASVFQIRDLMRDALRVITDLFHSFAYMSDSTCDYVIDRPVDQRNLHVLNPMYKSHCSVVDPR